MSILKGKKEDICDKEKDICVCVCGVCLYIVPCWTHNQDPLEALKVTVAISLFFI